MHIPIYSSQEHKLIIESYITMCKQFTQEVSSVAKYNNFLEVLDIIFEYSIHLGVYMFDVLIINGNIVDGTGKKAKLLATKGKDLAFSDSQS